MEEISKITISDSLVTDLHLIIEEGRKKAFAAAGKIAILTYWNIGRRIVKKSSKATHVQITARSSFRHLQTGLQSNTALDTTNAIWPITESFT